MGCGASARQDSQTRQPTEEERKENRRHRLKSRQVWAVEEVPGQKGLPKDPLDRAMKRNKLDVSDREVMNEFAWEEGSSPRHRKSPTGGAISPTADRPAVETAGGT
eukprot:TRINITY_DN26094_c0_g1_i1.p3 TRINITY_DN26094_c0_g1~~TRINITY_DN26094_c0_g1_i1.p3  ORF type:complete len:106 (+),score=21.51 TRINITY_DN26094_c0_g1_i1:112-429(+)